jgi:WD40 repeat protein
MSAIFVSHSNRDAAFAGELREWLGSKGHRSVFLDFDPQHGIPPGRDWEQELYQQIRGCRAVIVVGSRHWLASKWCFAEMTQARALGKALLPLRIDDAEIDGVIADRQIVDMTVDRAEAFDRLWRGLIAAGLDPVDLFDWDGTRPPYPGLVALQEEDAAVYFGRDDEVGAGLDVLNRVRRLGSAGVVVFMGASGVGKSSFIRAGIVPRLRRDPERWLVVDPFRPRDDPVRELAGVLSAAFGRAGEPRPRADLRDALHQTRHSSGDIGPNGLLELITDLRIATHRAEAKVLIVVDQFEEMLGYPADHPATDLLRSLCSATEAPHSPLVVAATLRSDFVGAFQTSGPLAGARCEWISVDPLSASAIAQIIEQPAKTAGLELGAGLVLAMVADTDSGGALPLLAFTLRELYEKYGQDGRMDVVEYRDQLGGLQGAVARVADELVETSSLDPDDDEALRISFLRMVRMTDDDRFVRRPARWDDLPMSTRPLLERFVAARLLVSSVEGSERVVEVAHEALFRSWQRLATWLERNTETLRLERDLRLASRSWRSGGQDVGDLWRGARLARVLELSDAREYGLDDLDREFVAASQHAELAEAKSIERRRRRNLQAAVCVAVVTSMLAVVAGLFYVRASNASERADRQARQVTALALGTTAQALVHENPPLALALAAESSALASRSVAQALDALVQARATFSSSAAQVLPPLTPPPEQVSDLAFSSDGQVLLAASRDGTIHSFDSRSGAPVASSVFHDGGVKDAIFITAADRVIFVDKEGFTRLWDITEKHLVGQPLDVDYEDIDYVAFSTDGTRLLFAIQGGSVRMWNPANGEAAGEAFEIPGDETFELHLSPDGTLLATESNAAVQLWDPVTGDRLYEPLGPTDKRAKWLGFSAVGHFLAFSDEGGRVQLWDPATAVAVGNPLTGSGAVDYIWYSADGGLMASREEESDAVRLWDTGTATQLGDPITYPAATLALVISQDDTRMATLGDDGIVRLFQLSSGQPIGQVLAGSDEDNTYGVAYSPDGKVLATAAISGAIQLWDPLTGNRIDRALGSSTEAKTSIAFSRQGDVLAAADVRGVVRLWEPTSGRLVGDLVMQDGHEPVSAVAFSPDGSLLATAVADGTVRLWDPNKLIELSDPLRGHARSISSAGVAFSPNGNLLAAAGDENNVRLWDPQSRTELRALNGHTGPVRAVSFSHEGTLLASGSEDGTIRVWDIATGKQIGDSMRSDGSIVNGVAFSTDDKVLASADVDGIQLWDPATGNQVGGDALNNLGGTMNAVAFRPDGKQVAFGGASVWLGSAVWDVNEACRTAEPLVTADQVRQYLPPGQAPQACDLP